MLKKLHRFACLFLLITGPFFLASSASGQEVSGGESTTVEFDRLWIDYNVTQDGQVGMIIHTSFTVSNMRDVLGYLTIRLEGEDGEMLQTTKQEFANTLGHLAVYKGFQPTYDTTEYSDLSVFLPYQEIVLGTGTHQLKVDADLISENGDLIQHLTLHPFEFTGSAQNDVAPSKTITAQFDKMWVDYDVMEGNELGMRIHASFSVQNMKDIPGYVGYAFETADGERLFTENSAFASTDGQLTIYKDINPAFEDTAYNDLQIFMPYRELPVGSGTHNLRIHADLLYENGGLVDVHLNYYDFSFTR